MDHRAYFSVHYYTLRAVLKFDGYQNFCLSLVPWYKIDKGQLYLTVKDFFDAI